MSETCGHACWLAWGAVRASIAVRPLRCVHCGASIAVRPRPPSRAHPPPPAPPPRRLGAALAAGFEPPRLAGGAGHSAGAAGDRLQFRWAARGRAIAPRFARAPSSPPLFTPSPPLFTPLPSPLHPPPLPSSPPPCPALHPRAAAPAHADGELCGRAVSQMFGRASWAVSELKVALEVGAARGFECVCLCVCVGGGGGTHAHGLTASSRPARVAPPTHPPTGFGPRVGGWVGVATRAAAAPRQRHWGALRGPAAPARVGSM